jgi:hypothetical protein
MGQGLVEMAEGLRVLAPLRGDLDQLAIGLQMRIEIETLYRDDDGRGVIAFAFIPS